MKANKICSIVLIVFAALWTLSILIFTDKSDVGFYYWGGIAFGFIALVLGALVNLFISSRHSRNTTEIEMLPVFATGIYAVVCVIFNSVFVYLKDGDYSIAIPAFNVIAMVVYLIYVYSLLRYADRVVATGNAINEKTSRYAGISVKMAQLLGMCNDADIKKKVLELKQKVDYSNNLAQNVSGYEEEDFYNAITTLESMLADGTSKEEILAQIENADNIWKARNSKLSVMS